jgi:cytochrome c-type biogenesis protein CcmE
MHPVRRQRLFVVIFIVLAASVAAALVMIALSENINLFYPPEKVVAGEAPEGKVIRIGGMVREGSIVREPGSLRVRFDVTDFKGTVPVVYDGILPDLFGEGQGAIAQGRLVQGVFEASEVLAKHDENYMPPELKDAMGPDHPAMKRTP